MFCGACGEAVLQEGICSKCNGGAFRTRLSRALAQMRDGKEASVAMDFDKLSKEDKATFIREHHDKFGAHLKMAIRQQVTVTKGARSNQLAMQQGHMKDEADLIEKFLKKPEQLAEIFKNAYSFTCPIRNCKLWADPDFVTEWNFTMTEHTEQILNLETNDSAKPT